MHTLWFQKGLASLAALLCLLLVSGCQSPTPGQVYRPGPDDEILFDGVSLNGWDGLADHWTVENGAITGFTQDDPPLEHNTFLVWTGGTVENFELRFRYRVFNGNSGVQYRSRLLDADRFIVGGYQADIEAGSQYSGILYEERGRGILALRGQRTRVIDENGRAKVTLLGNFGDAIDLQKHIRSEDWNDYRIRAVDNHLMHFINGKLMAEVIDAQPSQAASSGILALQIHTGPAMKVQFKDLYLKRLP